MNELKVTVTQNPGSIEINFDEIKAALELQMTAYTDMEIAESDIKTAKADLATLRKIRKALDDKRKEVKRDFMKPYDSFEGQAKELLGVIDKPIAMIDGKLKEYEQKRIAEKQAHLRELYEQHIGEYAEYLPYETVKSPKWDNATYTDKDIIADITGLVTNVRADLETIKALRSEIEEDVLNAYRASGNQLSVAIRKNTDYLDAKKAAEKRLEEERRAEEERKAEEARKAADVLTAEPEEKAEVSTSQTVAQETEGGFTEQAEEPTARFEIHGAEYIEKVRQFLDFSEIPYTEA